jgi:hypothetical protein
MDIISSFFGKHKKIYHAWKLPNIKNIKNPDFNKKSMSYLIGNLDQIIKDETARSDNRDFRDDEVYAKYFRENY